MEAAVNAVETVLNFKFRNKRLLEEALTHPSYPDAASYQRLEFIGDAALGLALSNFVFLRYPNLNPGQLSLLRAANISTEKLARVAIRHGFYGFVRRNANGLDEKVAEFAKAVRDEDDTVVYGGSVKAPKILADIVESIAGAIYLDVNYDLQMLWVIFRGFLEPIITLENLKQQPQPVTMLFELCQKHGKQVDIKHWKKGTKTIASVHVDGEFVTSASSVQKEIAKLNAAKGALYILSQSMGINDGTVRMCDWMDGTFEIEGAKMVLNELCNKRKWSKPSYKIEKDEGPSHEKTFVCSVQIASGDGMVYVVGHEKKRVKDAENSAASSMIRALQELKHR